MEAVETREKWHDMLFLAKTKCMLCEKLVSHCLWYLDFFLDENKEEHSWKTGTEICGKVASSADVKDR